MAKILVVDDDPELLRMVGLMLERGGHTALLESDPTQAIERIRAEEPDLLLLDVMMPAMSGHDLCRQIRATEDIAPLPVLVLTARAQPIDRDVALESGADAYMSKPVVPAQLMEAIDKLLADPSGRKRAMVISFFSMRGGVGRTTLAVNLACALRRHTEAEVGLLDLSPSVGQVAMHLRLQGPSNWDTLPALTELEWSLLKEQLLTHQSGLQVLAAPRHPQLPLAPSGELTTAVVNILSTQLSFIIIDLPPIFNPAVRAALSLSDMILHVVAPEVISVQSALQSSNLLQGDDIALKQKVYILNQTRPDAQIPAVAVAKGLKARPAFRIDYDPNQMRALTQGIPLALTAGESPLAASSRRMADALWQRVHTPAA